MTEVFAPRSELVFSSRARRVLLAAVLGSLAIGGVLATVESKHASSHLPETVRPYDINRDGYLSKSELTSLLNDYSLSARK